MPGLAGDYSTGQPVAAAAITAAGAMLAPRRRQHVRVPHRLAVKRGNGAGVGQQHQKDRRHDHSCGAAAAGVRRGAKVPSCGVTVVGGVFHHRRPPRSGRETSARI
eukprot:5464131-Prymnesium_polylepis.1